MHHFIYPSKDTYISNRPGYDDRNFGIDEILQIGTSNVTVRHLATTKAYSYTDTIFNNYSVQSFTGIFTGSFRGTASETSGSLSGSGIFSIEFASGSITGSSVNGYSGSISGSFNVAVSGSIVTDGFVETYTGRLTGSAGCLYGTGSGTDTRNEANWTTTTTKYVDRSLLHFDLTAISASISSGAIPGAKFRLKIKVCNEYELPITYTMYALPVSQSWNMGDGYFSDGGSAKGVSWKYKDNDLGNQWWPTYTSSARPPIDFISDTTYATASFERGGGTWYTGSVASQSFNYESSDINMDVTEIVKSWLSGSVPNQGFLLLHSDELQSTGSGFTLKFFSRDTNTIYSPYLDVMWLGNGKGGGSSEFVTGSLSTGSVTVATASAGMIVTVQSGSTFTIGGGIAGVFSGSTYLIISASLDPNYVAINGVVNGTGLAGNIKGMPVIGTISGSMSSSATVVTGSCGNAFTASIASATFIDGIFSGSYFTAFYVDYQFENAQLTGSWTPAAFLGTRVNIPLPSGIEPLAYAYVTGTFINGKALGTYTISGSTSGSIGSNSASFAGQFISGNLAGGYLNVQLSGSIFTSSYSYTSSVTFTTNGLNALDTSKPFTVIVQNVHPTYKAGDIVKMNVFGRKQFPLKTFGISTQQEQYLVPEYLPTSSYYALKDNETGEIVLDFDSYTQVSCDYPSGNYFVIDTTGLPQERFYRLLIRVEDSGSIYTTDCGKTFKITR